MAATSEALATEDVLYNVLSFFGPKELRYAALVSRLWFATARDDAAWLPNLQRRVVGSHASGTLQLQHELCGGLPAWQLFPHARKQWPTCIAPLFFKELKLEGFTAGGRIVTDIVPESSSANCRPRHAAGSPMVRVRYVGREDGDRAVVGNAPFPKVYKGKGTARQLHRTLPFVWAPAVGTAAPGPSVAAGKAQPSAARRDGSTAAAEPTSSSSSAAPKSLAASNESTTGLAAATTYQAGAYVVAYYECTVEHQEASPRNKPSSSATSTSAGAGAGAGLAAVDRAVANAEAAGADVNAGDAAQPAGGRRNRHWLMRDDRPACVAVGLARKQFPLSTKMPGWDAHSYGYHGDDGNMFHQSGRGQEFGPTFGAGDTIGCGICYLNTGLYQPKRSPEIVRGAAVDGDDGGDGGNIADVFRAARAAYANALERGGQRRPVFNPTGSVPYKPPTTVAEYWKARRLATNTGAKHPDMSQLSASDIVRCWPNGAHGVVFYTLNGRMIGPAFLDIDLSVSWYPCVGLDCPHAVSFNFGAEPFQFDIAGFNTALLDQISVPHIPLPPAAQADMERSMHAETLGETGVTLAPPPPSRKHSSASSSSSSSPMRPSSSSSSNAAGAGAGPASSSTAAVDASPSRTGRPAAGGDHPVSRVQLSIAAAIRNAVRDRQRLAYRKPEDDELVSKRASKRGKEASKSGKQSQGGAGATAEYTGNAAGAGAGTRRAASRSPAPPSPEAAAGGSGRTGGEAKRSRQDSSGSEEIAAVAGGDATMATDAAAAPAAAAAQSTPPASAAPAADTASVSSSSTTSTTAWKLRPRRTRTAELLGILDAGIIRNRGMLRMIGNLLGQDDEEGDDEDGDEEDEDDVDADEDEDFEDEDDIADDDDEIDEEDDFDEDGDEIDEADLDFDDVNLGMDGADDEDDEQGTDGDEDVDADDDEDLDEEDGGEEEEEEDMDAEEDDDEEEDSDFEFGNAEAALLREAREALPSSLYNLNRNMMRIAFSPLEGGRQSREQRQQTVTQTIREQIDRARRRGGQGADVTGDDSATATSASGGGGGFVSAASLRRARAAASAAAPSASASSAAVAPSAALTASQSVESDGAGDVPVHLSLAPPPPSPSSAASAATGAGQRPPAAVGSASSSAGAAAAAAAGGGLGSDDDDDGEDEEEEDF